MALSANDKEFIKLSLEPIKQTLEVVDVRLKKINGTVEKHNISINEANIEKEHQRQVNIDVLETKVRVDKIDENLIEYKMAKKYPKIFFISMFLLGAGCILMALHSMGIF